jgi:hypothetical protein
MQPEKRKQEIVSWFLIGQQNNSCMGEALFSKKAVKSVLVAEHRFYFNVV